MQCPHCLSVLEDVPEYGGTIVACPHCAGRFTAPRSAVAAIPSRFRPSPRPHDKTAGMLAAILSFLIPGLGQLCQGRPLAGLAFLASCLAAALGTILFVLPVIVLIPLWLWAVVDAATTRSP